MKIISILILSLILLTGCKKDIAEELTLPFEFDSEGNYTGFQELPEEYSAEQAEKDGCYVRKDLKAIGGEKRWNDFVKAASEGKDASVRIVSIYDEGTYYQDLFYMNGYYRTFDSSSVDLKDYKFQYMLNLEGKLYGAAKTGKLTILTDDPELTYKDVMGQFISSDSRDFVSPFKLVIIE